MTKNQQKPELDNFTRNYLYILMGLALIGVIWWLSNLDFRVIEINELLEADTELAAYPYPFRVKSLENGVAEVSSPRSAKLSAIQSLRVMYPELKQHNAVSDEMVAAQKELARVQSYAGQLVKRQEDVKTIRWILDQQWLAKHGIYVEQ